MTTAKLTDAELDKFYGVIWLRTHCDAAAKGSVKLDARGVWRTVDGLLATIASDRETLEACRHQITLQMARVEKVTADNERLHKELQADADEQESMEETIASDRQRIAELEKALKPFAKYAAIGRSDGWVLTPDFSVISAPNEGAQRHHIMMSAFLNADSAISPTTDITAEDGK